MTPSEPSADARRRRAGWRSLRGIDLFRALVADLLATTGAGSGDLLLHGGRRAILGAASEPATGELDLVVTTRLSPGCQALLTGEPVVIHDTLDHADERDPWCALAVAGNVGSVLALPLLADQGTVAALTAFAEAAAHFTRDRVRAATALAAEAAPVVLADLTGSLDGMDGGLGGAAGLRTLIGLRSDAADHRRRYVAGPTREPRLMVVGPPRETRRVPYTAGTGLRGRLRRAERPDEDRQYGGRG